MSQIVILHFRSLLLNWNHFFKEVVHTCVPDKPTGRIFLPEEYSHMFPLFSHQHGSKWQNFVGRFVFKINFCTFRQIKRFLKACKKSCYESHFLLFLIFFPAGENSLSKVWSKCPVYNCFADVLTTPEKR